MVHASLKLSYPKLHVFTMRILLYIIAISTNIIILDLFKDLLSSMSCGYDHMSCDISCNCSHMSLHCL